METENDQDRDAYGHLDPRLADAWQDLVQRGTRNYAELSKLGYGLREPPVGYTGAHTALNDSWRIVMKRVISRRGILIVRPLYYLEARGEMVTSPNFLDTTAGERPTYVPKRIRGWRRGWESDALSPFITCKLLKIRRALTAVPAPDAVVAHRFRTVF